jgi:hypothetical protein
MDSYGRELVEVSARLPQGDVSSSLRGDGPARFVFAECGPRSVELSRDGPRWWVEFWDGEAAAAELSFASREDAVQAARTWLGASKAEPAAPPDRGGMR